VSAEEVARFFGSIFDGLYGAAFVAGKPPRDRLIGVLDRIARELGPSAEWNESVITADVEEGVVTVAALQVAPFGEEETERYRREAEWAPLRWSMVRAVRLDPGNGWIFVMLAPNEDELARLRAVVDEASLLA
jgi:hypothetical protein